MHRLRLLVALSLFSLVCLLAGQSNRGLAEASAAQSDCDKIKCVFPPTADCLPSRIGVDCFENQLDAFVKSGGYLNWIHDREIRATGPFINGNSYGTHPAVKVYYSDQMWNWMISGRKGEIPDGAMIVKEQYPLPLQAKPSKDYALQGWSIMVKDSRASWDGWYWSSGAGLGNPYQFPYPYPWAGFGQYCVNCHASADNIESTFSTVNNVVANPMTYLSVAPSMIPQSPGEMEIHSRVGSLAAKKAALTSLPQPPPSKAFMALYNSIKESDAPKPYALPPESYDQVTQGPRPSGHKMFITSDQCIGCHDATQSNSAMPNMIYVPAGTQTSINLSPYGEWRASMMGLAGRDPIFFAQVETERALFPELAAQIDNKCFSCHGVMGQRQLENDTNGEEPFTHEIVSAIPPDNRASYGALARDGISCAVCHRISDKGLGTPETFTGQFKLGNFDEIFGPYKDVVASPMKNALGLEPKKTKADQIKSSALCGSCHIVETPILSDGGTSAPDPINNPARKAHEQSTYFEWRNSVFSDETKPAPKTAKTCQQCHMPGDYKGDPLKFRISNIEDNTFPYTDNRLPDGDITMKIRGSDNPDDDRDPNNRYSRHTLVGINLFGMRMFRQYYDSIGLRFVDPMATFGKPAPGMTLAEDMSLAQATKETAAIEIVSINQTSGGFEARVRVTNKAGHKFPSGVGFRRAFIEFIALDAQGSPLWASGRTNELGVILDGATNNPLPTEFFDKDASGNQTYQPYYSNISRGDQVQIYEELFKNKVAGGVFTTSFFSLAFEVKDTRLMPQGWKRDGPDANVTKPNGGDDRPVGKSYFDGSGADELTYSVNLGANKSKVAAISVRLYYQSIPPYYLQQRFTTAPDGTFTKNLWYYASRLNINGPGSPLESWKLKIAEASRKLR
jgi:cytochrome P460